MKAVLQTGHGPSAVDRFGDVAEPAVGPADVLIDIRAAGVDWADWSITHGEPYLIRLT